MSTNYENYKKRMESVRRFLGVVYKFRALIISAVVVIIAAIVSLMATNGIVYGEIAPPPEITYGELLSYEASAFMSDVFYEYCEAGHEKESGAWTREIPRFAGTYSVRAVSYRTFGAVSYGTTYKFTIKPLEVELDVADEVVYGERPSLTGGLINGDTITDFNFDYDALDSERTTVYIDTIKAENADGRDVSDCYVFKTEPESILFVRREITVTVTDKSKVYDGEPLKSDDYTVTVGSVADGDTLSVICDGEITDVGDVENVPSFAVSHGGVNVSMQYKITPVPGTLTVTHRPINVTTAEHFWDYDGQAHSDDNFEITSDYDIVGGESVTVVNSVEIVNAGTKDNALNITIAKSDGEDSTDNYDITYDYGSLVVGKLTIEISTESMSRKYDGSTYSCPEYSIISAVTIVEGETASVQSSTAVTNVGNEKNKVVLKVTKSDGSNSTDNYTFVLDDSNTGTLEITPRYITIQSFGDSKTYDGTPLRYDRVEITSVDTLAACDELVLDYVTEITDVAFDKDRNVCGVENEITVKVKRTDTAADSTGNYVISYDYGVLTVDKRPITVGTFDLTKVYDGTPLRYDRVEITSVYKLAACDELVLDYITEITDVAFDEERNVKGVENVITVQINKWATGANSSDNYVISYDYGVLTVDKRPITVTAHSDEKTYDGTPLTNGGYTVTAGNYNGGTLSFALCEGESMYAAMTFESKITNVGTEWNVVDSSTVVISSSSGNKTDNYDIQYAYGLLEVTPVHVTITADSLKEMYNGTPFTVNTFTVVVEGEERESGDLTLFVGDRLVVTMPEYSSTDVTAPYILTAIGSCVILDKNDAMLDEEHMRNYVVSSETGTLTVTPRTIEVATGSNSWVYDGYDHSEEGYEITSETKIADGQDDSVSYSPEIKYYGDMPNELVLIITANGVDVTYNYEIAYTYGTIAVDKRPITLTAGSLSKMYDGESLYCAEITKTPGVYKGVTLDAALAHDETLSASMTAASVITDAGEVHNEIDIDTVVIMYEDTETTENYKVTLVEGFLTIDKRPIILTAGSSTDVEYNGTYITNSDVILTPGAYNGVPFDGTLASGEMLYAEMTADSIIIDVGSVFNVIDESTIKITKNGGTYDTTDNYLILECVSGVLSVIQREISIKTNTSDNVYNGEPYFDTGYTVTSKLGITARDVATPVGYPSVTDVDEGKITNIFSLSIATTSGEPSDGNYKIHYDYGEIEVTPRPIIVYTDSNTWVYDGAWHDETGNTIDDPVSGERLVVNKSTQVKYYTELPIENVFEDISILKRDGVADSTGNYSISYVNGVLRIDKRPVTITADSDWKKYDGDPLTNGNYEKTPGIYDGNRLDKAIADGESIVALKMTDDSTITNAGTTPNRIDDASLKIAVTLTGEDTTDNYEITFVDGLLEIIPLYINVTADSLNEMYDGTEHTVDKYTVTIDDEEIPYSGGTYTLVKGDYMVVVMEVFSAINVTNPVITTEIKSVSLYNEGNGELDEEHSKNYVLTIEDGTLNIYKRPIKVVSLSGTYEYDGEQHTHEYIEIMEEYLADGEKCTIYGATVVTDYTPNPPKNILFIDIYKEDGSLSTDNYEIAYEYGTITITRRLVLFITAEHSWVYDGKYHEDSGYSVYGDGFDMSMYVDDIEAKHEGYRITTIVDGETIKVTDWPIIRYVAESGDNKLVFKIYKSILDADGRPIDSTDNYILEVIYRTISITPRPITIAAGSDYKEYDGTILVCYSYDLYPEGVAEDEGLAEGESISVIMTEDSVIYKAGSTPNKVDVNRTLIYAADNKTVVTNNYDITTIDGSLTIEKLKITVKACSDEKLYDGLPLTCYEIEKYKTDAQGNNNYIFALTDDPVYEMTADSIITEVGETGNKINRDTFKIHNVIFDEDVTDCYDITFVDGTLTVLPCKVEVTADSYDAMYDGKEHTVSTYTVKINDEPADPIDGKFYLTEGGAYFIVDMPEYSATHVSESRAVMINGVSLYDNNGNALDSDRMINVKLIHGYIGIGRRPITVVSNEHTWTYDGKAHWDLGFEIISEIGLAEGDEMSVKKYNTITNIGSIENEQEYKIMHGDRDVAEDDYIITVESMGLLKIMPIEILITTGNAEKEYDGEALTCSDYTVEGMPDGYHVEYIEITGSQTDVGEGENTVDESSLVIVRDEDGEDATDKFDVAYLLGILNVTPIRLVILTGTAFKYYDGTPLTYNFAEIIKGELLVGHRLTVNVTGRQTSIGTSDNTAEYEINSDYIGDDFTRYYEVEFRLGLLVVLDPSSPGVYPVAVLTTDYYGEIFLRSTSFGNYTGKGWDSSIDSYSFDDMSVLYYPAEALSSIDTQVNTTTVTVVKNLSTDPAQNAISDFLMPYYSQYADMLQAQKDDKSDIRVSGSYDRYTFTHYYLDYISAAYYGLELPSDYISYVHSSYLDVNPTTKEYLSKNILVEGELSFEEDDDVVETIAEYVRKVAIYVKNYDQSIDKADDQIIQFLRLGEGSHIHFASLATLLYRMVGIPARYTTGYVAEVEESGTIVMSDNAYAWVEIFVDDIGWVKIDVTGPEQDDREVIIIKPKGYSQVYDGTPIDITLKAPIVVSAYLQDGENGEDEVDTFAPWLAEMGFSYEAELAGAPIIDAGKGPTTIDTFALYDANGVEITRKYKIVYVQGEVVVTPAPVTVKALTVSKQYDGTPLTYDTVSGKTNYAIKSKTDVLGSIDLDLTGISITAPGTIDLAEYIETHNDIIRYYGQDGSEIKKENFSLTITGGLEVTTRKLILCANSTQKSYDGTALELNSWRYVSGSLAAGHTISVVVEGSIVDIGETENKIVSVIIRDRTGEDVTRFYEIETLLGTLTIT